MIPATAPWDDSSQQKTFTLPIRVDSNEWYTVYIIQIMNNQLVGEIAAVRTSCDCGMIRFEDSMRWPLVVSIPSPVNSSPEIKKNTLPMPWACCLMDPHPHGIISGSLFIIVMLYYYLYYTHLKLTAKVPEKMGETGIITIFSFPFAVWA